tara:strand:+ start:134 stop:613 length:480 start_codon:yes stop_codon:yes gene_type:complete
MSKLITDYTGRLSDIDIFGASDDPALSDVSLALSPGSVVGGKYKEAQKFLRILMSDTSVPAYSGYGTNLLTVLNQGLISNEAQFRALFSSAKADVINFLKTAKIIDGGGIDPRFEDDERIVDVHIQSLDVGLGSIALSLNFVYLGDGEDILIPVQIPVG